MKMKPSPYRVRPPAKQQIMAHSHLHSSGNMNRNRNIRITKNLLASGRLRAIFAERYHTF